MTLELHNLSISIGTTRLFAGLSLKVGGSEVATIMGPSGCGKSTLLALISGSLPRNFIVSGDIILNGKELNTVPLEKRRIGILFQDDLLFPHLSVYGNLIFALQAGIPASEKRTIIHSALSDADLEGFENRDVATLSGGQRARVSLLRTLLAKPDAILLDEPFSKLDHDLRVNFSDFVFKRIRQLEIPALLVTHTPEDSPGGITIDLLKYREVRDDNA